MKDITISSVLKESGFKIVSVYSLLLTVVGTPLNLLTFIVLCRSLFRDTRKLPAVHYIRVIAIFDTLILYGWNLDHFLVGIFGWSIKTDSIPTCRIIHFLSHFTAQSTAWFRVFLCLDRYLTLSRLHRTWLSQSKPILIVIGLIIGFFFLLNIHFLFRACSRDVRGIVDPNTLTYKIYPLWEYVHLAFYNVVPFCLMVLFNSGVIYHLIRHQRTSMLQNSAVHHRTISITLVLTTTLFLIMTIPSSIVFSFFYAVVNQNILLLMDCIYFTYHIISFPIYFITYVEFRRECLNIFLFKRNQRQIAPARNI